MEIMRRLAIFSSMALRAARTFLSPSMAAAVASPEKTVEAVGEAFAARDGERLAALCEGARAGSPGARRMSIEISERLGATGSWEVVEAAAAAIGSFEGLLVLSTGARAGFLARVRLGLSSWRSMGRGEKMPVFEDSGRYGDKEEMAAALDLLKGEVRTMSRALCGSWARLDAAAPGAAEAGVRAEALAGCVAGVAGGLAALVDEPVKLGARADDLLAAHMRAVDGMPEPVALAIARGISEHPIPSEGLEGGFGAWLEGKAIGGSVGRAGIGIAAKARRI